jgi:flagellar basal body P-ring formation protein FlgA
MRCSSKSTTWLARALAALAILLIPVSVHSQDAGPDEAIVRHAILEAVRTRMGAAADVSIERLTITGDIKAAAMIATPEPGSRTGRLVRFTLAADAAADSPTQGARHCVAAAEIHVTAPVVLLARAIEHGAALGAADLHVAARDVGSVPFGPLPSREDVIGMKAVRDMQPGDVITAALVRAQPLVRSGDTVRTRVRLGAVEVFGSAVAQQSGSRNDRIRLINPDSKRTFTGRVTGAGEVEVMHEP